MSGEIVLAAGGLAEVVPPVTADQLRAAGVVVAQCLLDPGQPGADNLIRAGFRPITRLVTLERSGRWHGSPVPLEPSDDILATYTTTLEGSLDLPELTGVRPVADELAAYPATGRYLLRLGEPVGVLMLAPGEILYLGLVPSARGRRLGDALLSFALRELGGTARVSADTRNTPALRLYERHGFRPCRSQDVFLWTPPESPPLRIKSPGCG